MFSTKIGPRVTINAARTALREGKTTEKKLGEMATIFSLFFARIGVKKRKLVRTRSVRKGRGPGEIRKILKTWSPVSVDLS